MFRSSGSLLPSHGLPPFGPMTSDLCTGMFHTPADRWGMGTGQISIAFISNCSQETQDKKKERNYPFAYRQDRKRSFDRLYYNSQGLDICHLACLKMKFISEFPEKSFKKLSSSTVISVAAINFICHIRSLIKYRWYFIMHTYCDCNVNTYRVTCVNI